VYCARIDFKTADLMGRLIKNTLPCAPPLSLLFATQVSYRYCFGLMTYARTDARSLRAATTDTARSAQNLVAEDALPVGLPWAAGFQQE
jgi:hypothetical protein